MASSHQDAPWYQDEKVYGANKWPDFGFDIELMDIIRAYNDILASNDTSLASRVRSANANLASKNAIQDVLHVIIFFIATIYLVIACVRLHEISKAKQQRNKKQRASRRAVLTLICYDLFVILMCIIQFIIDFTDFRNDGGKEKCNVLMKLSGAIYVIIWKPEFLIKGRGGICQSRVTPSHDRRTNSSHGNEKCNRPIAVSNNLIATAVNNRNPERGIPLDTVSSFHDYE